MNKTFDKAAAIISLFIIFFLWSYYIVGNGVFAFVFSAALALAAFFIFKGGKKSDEKTKNSFEKFQRQLSVMGAPFALEQYLKTKPESCAKANAENKNHIICKNTLIYSAFGFSDCSRENVCQAFRIAVENNADSIEIFVKSVSREAVAIAESLPVKITFVKGAAVYKKLKDAALLPPVFDMKKPFPNGRGFKYAFAKALSPESTKYYLYTGIVLAFLSFITPLKIYYITMSSISLALALSSVLIPRIREKRRL